MEDVARVTGVVVKDALVSKLRACHQYQGALHSENQVLSKPS